METKKRYFDRDLSWLSFNYRVLEELKDKTLPLYERIKFLAIYSSNMDEFYRVRVAYIRNLIELTHDNRKTLDYDPEEILEQVVQEALRQQAEYEYLVFNEIIPELEQNGIVLYNNHKLSEIHLEFIRKYFLSEVMPYLEPVLLAKGAILSFLRDNIVYLAIKMCHKPRNNKEPKRKRISYAILKLPTNHLPRFIELPKISDKNIIIFLDDIIRLNFDKIFPGYNILGSYSIKLSRDAEFSIEDEYSGNILDKIKKSLSKRKTGAPSRFLYDRNIPDDYLLLLKDVFNLSKKDFFPSQRYHTLSDFFSFPNPLKPQLQHAKLEHVPHPVLDRYSTVLEAVKENDILLHFPYHSYDYVLHFLHESALNPLVEEIKITQYRVASDSSVVRSLITAALNGKKVTVFVEVKARFDEEANLHIAEQMMKYGINVIAGLPGLKVHAKAALVIRKSSSKPGKYRNYAFLSTGNFNEKTAQIYSDTGFFTSNQNIIDELKNLFFYLEHPIDHLQFKHVLVPKFNLIPEFKRRIDREIENVKNGQKGYILLKMNGLEEREMIEKLYEASLNGVKIDLIVRGICCLIPNQWFSENITVTRIVDMYLEHARIFIFYNNGENETFISSADLMIRNLHRRVETVIPIYNEQLKKELREILEIQLHDNVKGRRTDENMLNTKKHLTDDDPLVRSQIAIYDYLKNKKDYVVKTLPIINPF